MIRPFASTDIRRITPNKYAEHVDIDTQLSMPDLFIHSVVDDDSGDVVCIMAFKQYWGQNYHVSLIASDKMTFAHGKEIKQFIEEAIVDLGAKRVQTDSMDCPELNRWHEFIGFKSEGVREKMVFDTDYRMWGMVI